MTGMAATTGSAEERRESRPAAAKRVLESMAAGVRDEWRKGVGGGSRLAVVGGLRRKGRGQQHEGRRPASKVGREQEADDRAQAKDKGNPLPIAVSERPPLTTRPRVNERSSNGEGGWLASLRRCTPNAVDWAGIMLMPFEWHYFC